MGSTKTDREKVLAKIPQALEKKPTKTGRRMSFRQNHPRLFILFLVANFVMVIALPLGFYLVFHPPQATVGAAQQTDASVSAPVSSPQAGRNQASPISPQHPKRPKQVAKIPPNPDPGVAIQSGATVQQQSLGGCSPNIIGNNNSPNCGVMPRKIDPEQLAEAMKPYAGINSQSSSDGTGGASRIEDAITAALGSAGWRHGGHNVMMGNVGMVVLDAPFVIAFNPDSDAQYGKAAEALQSALAAQKVKAEIKKERRLRLNFIQISVSAQ
jgi:hypothetical protein